MLDHPETVFREPAIFNDDPAGGVDHSTTGVCEIPRSPRRKRASAFCRP